MKVPSWRMSIPFPLLMVMVTMMTVQLDVTTGNANPKPTVIRTTSKGRVQGYTDKVLGHDVHVFLGIPYARPPVGELRFKPPEPAPEWADLFDATHLPASCYQVVDTSFDRFAGVEMWNPNTALSEDCLYLNVWEPASASASGASKRAVMVWIYGGGLFAGTSTLDLYDARTLAAEGDVVVVSMQYRLGALGFLYLGTPDAPGNQGLLDQHLALRWVHDNVDRFGGDPARVTLFGESAGALSVNLQLLSPLSKGLVRSGIMQSGSAIAPWGFHAPDVAKARAKSLAKLVGCSKKTDNDAVRCLRGITASVLTERQFAAGDPAAIIPAVFVSTVDGHFLTEPPVETLKKGNFKHESVLMGVNHDEGAYFLAYQQPDYLGVRPTKDITVDVYRSIVQAILELPPGRVSAVAESVAFEYGAPYGAKNSSDYRKVLDDVMGDPAFKCPVVEAALAYAGSPTTTTKTAVYLYEFNHRTSANTWPAWMGVMHGYEIDHVFGMPLNASSSLNGYTPEEAKLSRSIVTYWTNFAKTGNPNKDESVGTEWPPFTATNRSHLLLESSRIIVQHGLRARECDYWRDIVPALRRATHKDGKWFESASEVFLPSTFSVFSAIASAFVVIADV